MKKLRPLLKYLPSVIFALVEVWVAMLVLDNAGYSNYQDVMAGLIVIYATIRTIGIGIGLSMDKLVMGLTVDLISIKERIRKDLDTDEAWEELKSNSEKSERTSYKLIIRGIGVFIIYIMGLVALLG